MSHTLYNSDENIPLSTNLHPDFLKTRSKTRQDSDEPESPRVHTLFKENYDYVPLEIDINFNPATLEHDFFWISRLKNNLKEKSASIEKICQHYTEKLGYISKLNNLWKKYNKIQDNLAIEFGKIDDYLNSNLNVSPYMNQKLKIALTLGLIIPHLKTKHKENVEKLTKNRTNIFYYYYFIKNTFLPELKETQKLLTNYQPIIEVPQNRT